MIKLENISKKYGAHELFSNFSAEFEEHRVSCILGASGVGKTTLINIIAGLNKPDGGIVRFGSQEGELRGSYVFQEARLLPWLNVHDNLDLVLKNARKPLASEKADDLMRVKHGRGDEHFTKEERIELIRKQLRLVELEPYEFSMPSELSGGMVQRVALARAFAFPADILFLDEPFKEQDPKLKEELYESFFRAYKNDEAGRTVLFVTHDISEALRLADTIYVLAGTPAEIVGKFDRAEFSDELKNKIKELL
ncbi:MAG: ABC transporter ATP-binding protein [Clostridia bacterium]|nr:ABC transporter ATP-binding protein [Clostridia bacterium]